MISQGFYCRRASRRKGSRPCSSEGCGISPTLLSRRSGGCHPARPATKHGCGTSLTAWVMHKIDQRPQRKLLMTAWLVNSVCSCMPLHLVTFSREAVHVVPRLGYARASLGSTSPSRSSDQRHQHHDKMTGPRQQPTWLLLAIASGACAAFNGVFAKLCGASPPSLRCDLQSPQHDDGAHHDVGKVTGQRTQPQPIEPSGRARDPRSTPSPQAPLCVLPRCASLTSASLRATALLRPQLALQRRHVGPVHARTDARQLDCACQHHQHIGQLHVDGRARRARLRRGPACALVARRRAARRRQRHHRAAGGGNEGFRGRSGDGWCGAFARAGR